MPTHSRAHIDTYSVKESTQRDRSFRKKGQYKSHNFLLSVFLLSISAEKESKRGQNFYETNIQPNHDYGTGIFHSDRFAGNKLRDSSP